MSYDTRFRPQMGHWTENVVIFQNGELGVTFHVAGVNSELMDEAALIGTRQDMNQLALSTTHPRLQWYQHFTRVGQQKVPDLQPSTTWWAQSFDQAVLDNCIGNVHRNDLFFTLIVRPRSDIRSSIGNMWRTTKGMLFSRKRLSVPSATAVFLEDFENTVSKTRATLVQYGAKQLELREEGGVWFSQIWEAHHLIGNGFWRAIPLSNGTDRAGRQVIPNRVIFGHREYQVVAEGPRERWGAILGYANYPASTHPLMFEKLKQSKYDFTLTNSMLFRGTQKAIDQLGFKQAQLGATQDSPRQMKKVGEHAEDLKENLTAYGVHHFSLTVRADSQAELNTHVWEAEEIVAKGGATITRYDSKTLKPAYYATYPGSARWRVRRGNIPSINFAGFAAFNNVPTGSLRSRWGGPLFFLRTTRNTFIPYHLHVTGDPNIPKEDVASWMTVGGMGSGKTSHNGRKAVAGMRVGARSIIFDKDCGLAPTVMANDGEYFVLEDGEQSGTAPLRALRGTPDDVNFMHSFLIGLIEGDNRGPIMPAEDMALGNQVLFQMSLPPELRSIDGIWPLLGSTDNGAGSRLRKWGRLGRLGWAFDGERDRISLQGRMIGFDTTALLKNPLVCQPMLTYLFYRIQSIVYERKPLIIMLDECWQTLGKFEGAEVDNSRFVYMFNDQSKTIRKNEGAIGVITQSAADLLASTMARTIQQNMPTKEFFGDRQAQAEDLIDGFNLTPREFHIVKNVLPSIRYSFLVKRPNSSFIAVNDMSGIPGKVAVLSGRRSTYDLAIALREKYGDRSNLWVPHYENLAPRVVDDPHLDVRDLIEGRAYPGVRQKELA